MNSLVACQLTAESQMGLYSPIMNVYSANMRNSVPATDLTADELEDLLKSPKASAEFLEAEEAALEDDL